MSSRCWRIWVRDHRTHTWTKEQVARRLLPAFKRYGFRIGAGPVPIFYRQGYREGEWSFDIVDPEGVTDDELLAVMRRALAPLNFSLRRRPQDLGAEGMAPPHEAMR